jgi:hypothetical protein
VQEVGSGEKKYAFELYEIGRISSLVLEILASQGGLCCVELGRKEGRKEGKNKRTKEGMKEGRREGRKEEGSKDERKK